MKRFDFVGSQLVFAPPPLLRRNVLLVAHEIRHRRLSAEREIHAEELARAHARQGQCGFAQGFARDRTGVDPGATHFRQFFDQRDAFAKNSSGVRSANSCRTAADHDKVKVLGHRYPPLRIAFYAETIQSAKNQRSIHWS